MWTARDYEMSREPLRAAGGSGESLLGYPEWAGRMSAAGPIRRSWINGSAPVCCLLQKAGAPLLPCLCCCALHRPQDEDLHQRTQSTNQAALLLPVQAKVGAGPKVCRGVGACGVSLQRRFSIVLSGCILCNAV